MPKLTPEDQATLEFARRIVCGDRGEIQVHENGTILSDGVAFKLAPSRDPIDALIVAIAKAMQRHLGGVDLGKLRHDLVAAGVGKEAANFVDQHLGMFSVEDWDAIRARVGWYVQFNVDMRLPDTEDSGGS